MDQNKGSDNTNNVGKRVWTLDDILKLLWKFYIDQAEDPQKADYQQINEELQVFQHSIEAWNIANNLLSIDYSKFERLKPFALHFGVQTLKRKIASYWDEVPKDFQPQIQKSVLEHLVNFSKIPQHKSLAMYLCGAVADLLLFNEECVNIVTAAMNLFGNQLDLMQMEIIIEILTALPEEAGDTHLDINYNQRNKLCEQLENSSATVFTFLGTILQSAEHSSELKRAVFTCATVWLRSAMFRPSDFKNNLVIARAFEALRQGEEPLFEAAVDTICELIETTGQDLSGFNEAVGQLISQVMQHSEQLQTSLQNRNSQITRGLALVFSQLGESYVSLIAQGSPDALRFAALLLQVTAYPEHQVSGITFRFWRRLYKAMTTPVSSKHANSDPHSSSPETFAFSPTKDRTLRVVDSTHAAPFCDIWGNLLIILSGPAVQFPQDVQTWSSDNQEDFQSFRSDARDLCTRGAHILGGQQAFNTLLQQLSVALNNNNSKPTWPQLEAIFFAVRNIAPIVNARDPTIKEALSKLFEVTPSLAAEPAHLKNMAILFLGNYASALTADPRLIEPVLTFISPAVFVPELARSASQALRMIVVACPRLLVEFAQNFVNMSIQIENYQVSLHAKLDLLQCNSTLLSMGQLGNDKISEYVKTLTLPHFQALFQQLHLNKENQNVTVIRESLIKIEQIFHHLTSKVKVLPSESHPYHEAIMGSWLLFEALFDTHGNDGQIVDLACNCLKQFMYTTTWHLEETLVPIMLAKLVPFFSGSLNSRILELIADFFCIYGAKTKNTTLLAEILDAITMPVFSFHQQETQTRASEHLEFNSETTYRRPYCFYTNHPDLICDFFHVLEVCADERPEVLFQNNNFKQIWKFAVHGLVLQHREGLKQLIYFFSAVLKWGAPSSDPRNNELRNVVLHMFSQDGTEFVTAVIKAIVELPASRAPFFSRIFLTLFQWNDPQVAQIVAHLVNQLPSKMPEQKQQFLSHIFSTDPTQVKDALRKFADR